MKSSFKVFAAGGTMRVLILVCMGVLLAVGCGYDPRDPAYDTAENPQSFPDDACRLLDRIEAGQLASFDLITEAFARLYTEHSDLFENEQWRQVINRLGGKFAHRADQLLERGIDYYSQAAGFYALAAFARPDDDSVLERSRLFAAWSSRVRHLDSAGVSVSLTGELPDRIEFTKHFVLGDSLEREFARQFLIDRFLQGQLSGQGDDASATAELPLSDRAFLAHVGLGETPADSPLARFEHLHIDLIAYSVVLLAANTYRAELYFVPRETIRDDYSLTVRLDALETDTVLGEQVSSHFVSTDFTPVSPTSHWSCDKVAVAVCKSVYGRAIDGISIGLYLESEGERQYLFPAGHEPGLIELPISVPPSADTR